MSTSPLTVISPAKGGAVDTDPDSDANKPARKTPWMRWAIIAVVVVLIASGINWLVIGRFVESTDDAYVGGDVTVMAPKVSGFVTKVLVQDNQYVNANQVLVQLDSRDYDARLAQADADVQSAEAAVAELQARKSLQLATIGEQAAQVRATNAELTRSEQDQTRYRELVKDNAVSDQLVERAHSDAAKAHAAVDRSNASLLAAQRQMSVLDAQIGNAQAHIAMAKATQRVAALNVEYTTIRAPIAGYIGNRTARVGTLANTGISLLTVVPAKDLWVDANFKEDQLKKMRLGDTAEVSFDVSGSAIHGVVESVAPATGATFSLLPAENATGNFTKIVQRVPVRIHLEVPHELQNILRPGLSATVKVKLNTKLSATADSANSAHPQQNL
jgi:membrane fusion protein (multidrug efflux system)